jgi:molybdate transport system ATP-binding protein
MSAQSLSVRLTQEQPIPLSVELACASGEMLALVGPSGSGKTTTLRSIAGLYRPLQGRVSVNGETWFDSEAGLFVPPYRRKVGVVFQQYALFPHLTAIANVTAALDHFPRQERNERARGLLAMMHMGGLEERRPGELSGGQQQRVALARALARDPAVLLLDEPFSAVDRRTRRRLHAEIAELRRTVKIPIVLVTHDIDETLTLADRMCVLDSGEVLQIGAPREVVASPANQRVIEALDLPGADGSLV